jgi:sensor domain CHASE-containing protein
MKKVLFTVALMVLASPAAAMGGHNRGSSATSDADRSAAAKKAKEIERAYQEALKRIPDSTKKQDPWDNMR